MRIVDMVESQLIASIKEKEDIQKAIDSRAKIAFLLTGNLMNMQGIISELKSSGMYVFIHLDFIEGLSNTKSALQFIAQVWKPTGIITTKSNVVKLAKEEGLMTIQRIFLIDRAAVQKGIENIHACKPDAVEVLPGLMPKIIDDLSRKIRLPLIVGGLISEESEILAALKAGALAVSSGNPAMWQFDL